MNRNIFAACGALAIAGISLSASQTPTTTTAKPAQAPAQSGTVTITGCLMPYAGSATTSMGTPGTAGTAGTSGTTATPGTTGANSAAGMQYVLTNVEHQGSMNDRTGSTGTVTPGAKPATPGTTPTTPGTTPATPGTMQPAPGAMDHASGAAQSRYILRAEGSSVNLSQHVNHKVEITGRMASMDSSRGTTGATGTAPGSASRPAGAMDANPQTLTVTALKMVAATCK